MLCKCLVFSMHVSTCFNNILSKQTRYSYSKMASRSTRHNDSSCSLVLSPFTAISTLMLQSSKRLFLLPCQSKTHTCPRVQEAHMASSCLFMASCSDKKLSSSSGENLLKFDHLLNLNNEYELTKPLCLSCTPAITASGAPQACARDLRIRHQFDVPS